MCACVPQTYQHMCERSQRFGNIIHVPTRSNSRFVTAASPNGKRAAQSGLEFPSRQTQGDGSKRGRGRTISFHAREPAERSRIIRGGVGDAAADAPACCTGGQSVGAALEENAGTGVGGTTVSRQAGRPCITLGTGVPSLGGSLTSGAALGRFQPRLAGARQERGDTGRPRCCAGL